MDTKENTKVKVQYQNIPKVTIIIVSWNVRELLVKCLDSIYKKITKFNFEIIVIDNNSSDFSAKVIKNQFPEVILIQNKINVGYSAAVNDGLANAKGDYYLILNPDTVVLNDICEIFINFFRNNPNVGAVGGKALLPNGNIDYCSARNLPNFYTQIFELFYLSKLFSKNRLFGKYNMGYWNHNSVKKVEFISGQLIMVRRIVIENIGNMDDNFFLYYEDTDLCRRIIKDKWDIVYLPQAEILHYDSQSAKRHPEQKQINLEMFRSMLKYHRKHEGKIIANILRFLLFFTYSIKTTIAGFILIFTKISNKKKWKVRMLNYFSVVKWTFNIKPFKY